MAGANKGLKLERTIGDHPETITALIWIADGEEIVTIAGDTARLWSLGTGKLIRTWDNVSSGAWSEQENVLYLAGPYLVQAWWRMDAKWVAGVEHRPFAAPDFALFTLRA